MTTGPQPHYEKEKDFLHYLIQVGELDFLKPPEEATYTLEDIEH